MANSKKTSAYSMALGGLLAALGVVVMSLGTIIPVATYICPMICMILAQVVLKTSGTRVGWAWYGAVAILSLLLAPDKEAAAVFAALGYYPIVKPRLEKTKWPWLWKAVLFNAVILTLYWLLMHLFGMDALAEEFAEAGAVMTAVMLLLGNVIFFLLDRVLSKRFRR
ncbi:MAG: hypothetical protein MR913_06720 [Clostridiales bacterium]|nr:hypothetical protein [Clostridiales bacterium]